MLPKAVVICLTLLCAYVAGTSEPLQFDEKLNQHTTNSSTFFFLYQLYTVKKNDTHIEVSKTEEYFENAKVQCTAKLYPVKDQMVGRMNIVPGVYTFLISSAVDTKIVDKTRKTHIKTMLLDHINCTYGTISLPLQEVPVDYPNLPPLVLSNIYGFDIFYPNKECSPCYVFDNSGFMKPKLQLKVDAEKPSRGMLLKTAKWPKQSPYGYFYAYNFANGTAVIRFLSKKYETIKEKYVGHPIDAADACYSHAGDTTYVGFCHGNGTEEFFCGQYDGDLNVRYENSMNLTYNDTYASGMTIKVDKQGHSMIALVQSPIKQQDKKHVVSFFMYDNKAKLIGDAQVAEFDQKYRQFDLSDWFYDYGLRQEYCVHVAGRETVESTDAHEIVKCLLWNKNHTALY